MEINYSTRVIVLPHDCVLRELQKATAEQLRVMLYVCANTVFRADPEKNRALAVKDLHMQWAEIEEAIAFWRAAGAITDAEGGGGIIIEKKQKTSFILKREAPEYTAENTAEIIESDGSLKQLLDICGRLLGKMLNSNEVYHIVSMYDYLRLSSDYIVMLMEYCIEIDKKSVVYITRMAYSMFENDITTPEALSAHLETERKKNSMIHKIRELFGVGSRALITREKNSVNRWITEYGFSYEMIERAYELTVEKIDKASFDYANGILKKWHTAGITSLEQLDEEEALRKKKIIEKDKDKDKDKGFDVDEFMALALKRSYKDKKD